VGCYHWFTPGLPLGSLRTICSVRFSLRGVVGGRKKIKPRFAKYSCCTIWNVRHEAYNQVRLCSCNCEATFYPPIPSSMK